MKLLLKSELSIKTYYSNFFCKNLFCGSNYDLVNHDISESSCIFIHLYALKLSNWLHRNQKKFHSLMKKKKTLQSKNVDVHVQGQEVAWKVSIH